MKKQFRLKNKYGVAIDKELRTFMGRTYQSKKECQYAQDLEWRRKGGEVKEWKPQFKLDLRVNDQHITNYYIDFRVELSDGTIQYVEVKGFEIDLWRLKWRITKALWPNIPGVEENAELVLYK